MSRIPPPQHDPRIWQDVDELLAKLVRERDALLAACGMAYVSLLKLPISERLSRQKDLCCTLRDLIAELTHENPSRVQDAFTAEAEGR